MAVETAVEQRYTLDNSWTQARKRLALLEADADPRTIRYLEALGVAERWHCADVAAGGGSIAKWLCRRVGTTGHVLATDINTRFLDVLDYPNLDVWRHDIIREALPERAFDLVHARALLLHLSEREVALRHMVEALKPGGWLLVEDADYVSLVTDPRCANEAYAKGVAAIRQYVAAAGFDSQYGRRLFGDMRAAGLVDIDGEGHVGILRPGTHMHQFMSLSFTQLRDGIIQAGLLTNEEADDYLAAINDDSFVAMNAATIAVWGRKPG